MEQMPIPIVLSSIFVFKSRVVKEEGLKIRVGPVQRRERRREIQLPQKAIHVSST